MRPPKPNDPVGHQCAPCSTIPCRSNAPLLALYMSSSVRVAEERGLLWRVFVRGTVADRRRRLESATRSGASSPTPVCLHPAHALVSGNRAWRCLDVESASVRALFNGSPPPWCPGHARSSEHISCQGVLKWLLPRVGLTEMVSAAARGVRPGHREAATASVRPRRVNRRAMARASSSSHPAVPAS